MPKPQAAAPNPAALDRAPIASALRTLEAEFGGISALSAAMQNGLGASFLAAVETIRNARGRVIVSGMGKSGHIGHKIAATLSSTGTPAFFVHPAEASHGDLGMITADDVIIALSWSGETAELKSLIDYSRRFRIPLIAVTAVADSTLAQAADVALVLPQAREACPHNLAPTTSSLMQLAHRRCAGDRAAGKPRLHRARFSRPASRRTAWRAAEIRARRHAFRRQACRSCRPARGCRMRWSR